MPANSSSPRKPYRRTNYRYLLLTNCHHFAPVMGRTPGNFYYSITRHPELRKPDKP